MTIITKFDAGNAVWFISSHDLRVRQSNITKIHIVKHNSPIKESITYEMYGGQLVPEDQCFATKPELLNSL
jgi:hypothetical protein